jgi:fermentation-respiration switch protein FrsA (DUF1100 family)
VEDPDHLVERAAVEGIARVRRVDQGAEGLVRRQVDGDRDDLVPLMYGQELYDAAPEPKRMHALAGVGHNDLVERAGNEWVAAIAEFARVVGGGG